MINENETEDIVFKPENYGIYKTEMEVKPMTEKADTTLMYLGPTIPRVVNNSRVFINGIPDDLKERVQKYPSLSKFLVPISELKEVRKKLRDESNAYSILYKDLEKAIKRKEVK